MKTPLVSIIIPSYKHEDFIQQCIESCLNQTYKNLEIIVINDGSPDNTNLKVKPYIDKIVYIEQENMGLAKTRNVGLNKAQGEYIQFLDSDDSLHPDKIKLQVDFLEKNIECIGVYCDYAFSNMNNDQNFRSEIAHKYSGYITNKLVWYNWFTPHTMLTRKSKIRFTTKRTCLEDWEYWLYLTNNKKVGYIDKILCYIDRGPEVQNMSSNMLRMTLNEISIRMSLLKNNNYIKYYHKIFIKLIMNIFGGIPAGIIQKIKTN